MIQFSRAFEHESNSEGEKTGKSREAGLPRGISACATLSTNIQIDLFVDVASNQGLKVLAMLSYYTKALRL